jgi:REP element-mobilizing transposase RayT
MPRQARLDAPGALHHIVGYGVERTKLFWDDSDREAFQERLANLLKRSNTDCYAWALLPNHFHLLIKTGQIPVSKMMLRLLGGYASEFNRRHRRRGHLFHNRYRSVLCQEEIYLRDLVCYIHLNPLRAGVVANIRELNGYPYCGHATLVGDKLNNWMAADHVLSYFGSDGDQARTNYRSYLRKCIDKGRRPDLIGGGLIRSAGGWKVVKALRKTGIHHMSDERILGSGEFVQGVLRRHQEQTLRRLLIVDREADFEKLTSAVGKHRNILLCQLVGPNKRRTIVKARYLICYWAVRELGFTMTEIARKLEISLPTVSVAVHKGAQLIQAERLDLENYLTSSTALPFNQMDAS